MKNILSAFDISGPVMIGPSSSHTAGACRLGYAAQRILGEQVKLVTFHLYGSFRETQKGHGTDKALLGGILGFQPSDERIRDAYSIADERSIEYQFSNEQSDEEHPNTVVFELEGVAGNKKIIKGISIGGGNICITKIDATNLQINGKYNTLITKHWDRPGIVQKVTAILAKYQINIAQMNLYREHRNDFAYMILEADQIIEHECTLDIEAIPDMVFAVAINKLF